MTVQEWVLQDRQWSRHCRIAYAAYQRDTAKTPREREFWLEVLERYT